jgi:hypothetical protein
MTVDRAPASETAEFMPTVMRRYTTIPRKSLDNKLTLPADKPDALDFGANFPTSS